jgi:hypothetical protein
MVSVRIDGEQSTISGEHLPRLIDLIEVIKDHIVPGHMITALRIDGRAVSDEDWEISPRYLGGTTLEVTTGTPAQYLKEKVSAAPEVIDNCYLMFRATRKAFIDGDSQSANQLLRAAVDNLQAFVSWYRTMLELMPEDQRLRFGIDPEITEMGETLERICMQQLTQSWKLTGDTISKALEPQLDNLHSRMRVIIANEPGYRKV